MRHVSQLKKFVGLIAMSLMTLVIPGLCSIHLHETSPVFWKEVDDKFVSQG